MMDFDSQSFQNEYASNLRWTPFGDVSLDMGCLAVVEASHEAPQFKQLQVSIYKKRNG